MVEDLSTRLRQVADDARWNITSDVGVMLRSAADSIDTLTLELAAAISQRERMIDAMKEAQAKLREMQDYIIAPKDDGL